MTALEYINSINPAKLHVNMNEEEALAFLIRSHAAQRAIILEDSRRWISSPEGKAWQEQVEKMTLQECLDYFQKE